MAISGPFLVILLQTHEPVYYMYRILGILTFSTITFQAQCRPRSEGSYRTPLIWDCTVWKLH